MSERDIGGTLPMPIVLLDQAAAYKARQSPIMDITELELPKLGESFHIGAVDRQARLTDIVPVAQALCSKITDAVVENVRKEGDHVPCHKGCAACCFHLVLLSVPEALRLSKQISAMPERQRELMMRSFLSAARCILERKPPKSFNDRSHPRLDAISHWYANLRLACPFLDKEVCIFYEQRPIACREYFVKGSARACKGQRDTAGVIEMPVQMDHVLSQLTSRLEGVSAEAVMLPLVLVWYQDNLKRNERTWPATMMVERFVQIVKTTLQKNSGSV